MSVTNLKNEKNVRRALKQSYEAGWKCKRGQKDWICNNPMASYFFDIQTGYRMAAVQNVDDFLLHAMCKDGKSNEEIVENLSSIICSLADGCIGADEHQEVINAAFYYVARYAGITKTFQMTTYWPDLHFFVLLYRQPGKENVSELRPFVCRPTLKKGVLMQADMAYEYIKEVVRMDRARHPEWLLPAADIIPFQRS